MTEAIQKQLAAWLHEREIDLQLPRPDAVSSVFQPPVEGDFRPAAVGDIRLLTGGSTEDPPCYVLLVPADDAAAWQLIPFSPYTVPATDREWKLRDEGALQVLQLWNARFLSGQQVPASWWIETLTPDQWIDVMRDGGSDRRGPSLQHPFDPRHEYMDEAWAWFDRCLGFMAESNERSIAAERQSELLSDTDRQDAGAEKNPRED